ncbi:aspartate racemase [Gillisia mitskevichiae]|uniref:Aspartate racemase n=1 Tax=Gillisia mitskevichiae TaxID=270921 RepID=A0A495PT90_9FLAO|nr:amino acid racemase [Gillisia mitskevichiae]RKS53407.1 aspartate racemase [Gillisia mitskevichiae]
MRKIGLIGGTSWHSTIVYYRMINEMVGEKRGTWGNPPLIIYSLNIELMREQNKEKINMAYLDIAKKLESIGAKALVICANTPHMVFDYVQPKIGIPILHIADAVGLEATNNKIKKLGLLGNQPTMTRGFMQEYLKGNFSIETIIPDPEYIDKCHYYISNELTQGKFTEEAKSFFIDQMELLKAKGAEGIILGCTELPMLLKQNNFNLPLLATTDLHAEMVVKFILEDSIVS